MTFAPAPMSPRVPLSVAQTPAEPLHIDHLQRGQVRVFNHLVQHKQARQYGSSELLEPFRGIFEEDEGREGNTNANPRNGNSGDGNSRPDYVGEML